MQLEEIEEKKEILTEEKTEDLFYSIIMGKECTETIKTSRGDFKVKFPRVRDLEEIGRKTAWRLNGIPARCFDADTYSLMQEVASLDVLIIDGPDWYIRCKEKNQNFSFGMIPDQSFIQEVYALAYNFRIEVQKRIQNDKESGNNTMAVTTSGETVAQPGLFEGVSG